MQITPFLCWDVIHVGAVGWNDKREPLPCDVPRGVALLVEPAAKTPAIVVADRPWEGELAWAQVMEDGGRYRLWYGVTREARKPKELLCYAESADGKVWHKPELGLVKVDGDAANNVVHAGAGMSHFCVVRCPREAPARRYRCMYFKAWWEGQPGEEIDGDEGLRRLDAKNAAKEGDKVLPVALLGKMLGMDSPDGLSWTPIAKPLLDEWHDTHNICVYDEAAGKFRGYFRGALDGRRAISYSETKDFENWPPSHLMAHHLNDDLPDECLYSNCYTRYPGRPDIHLMFPAVYHLGSDTIDGQLAASLNGINWARFTRQTIIPHGVPGEPDAGGIYPEPELLRFPEDGKFRLLCLRTSRFHNEWYNRKLRTGKATNSYAWAEWPEDRLAGIHAVNDGEFTTQLQTCGDRLLANYRAAPGGWITFELVNRLLWPPQQWPGIEGCRFENSQTLNGDETHAPVRWNGSADISRLKGKPVAIRVRLRKCTLFSVTMYGADEPLVRADPRYPV